MKKYKNQTGAISLFTLLSMLFFLTFMVGAFTLVSRRNAAQVEALQETQAIYNSGSSASDIYDSIMSSSDTVIPISNKEQLEKIIEITNSTDSEANYMIGGKLYTYKKNANYVLNNDIILDLKEEINEKNNITIYDYVLYSDLYNIDANGYNIYYAQTDGSVWKCVSYQNIGTSSSKKIFSTEAENEFYYGKSAAADRYSILEDGIDKYKEEWDPNTNFEFMLMYNCYDKKFDSSKYNRWRQTNNPVKETILSDSEVTTAEGYTIDFTGGTTAGLGEGNNWGGLVKSTTTSSYLTGGIGSSDISYAVATTTFSGTYGIPVSSTTNGTDTASECLLFVRVK